jgi:eukaryotic-like serine/threonine-protein kinase
MSNSDDDQFVRIKALFNQLCDLSPEQIDAALTDAALAADADHEVIDAVRKMLTHTELDDTHFAEPVWTEVGHLASDEPSSGDVLGAWTLLEKIGEGGMGQVFLARRSDGHFEQTAAVKLLSGVPSARALRYLARERQILASLTHPNISRLLDGGSTPGGRPYLVMEYVDGVPIKTWCDDQAVTTQARVQLLIELCDAVAFAHRQLVIHCDLKPSNILVTEDGRPILLDFGVARHLLDAIADDEVVAENLAADHTATSKAYTPRYASPEQRAMQRVGTATDIYSLGLVLAELLGARRDSSDNWLLDALPRDLAAIVVRATETEVSARYPGVDALSDDLRRWLNHEPVKARQGDNLYVAGKWLHRNWPWAGVGLAFLLTISLFSWQMRAERDRAVASELAARAVTDFMIDVFQGADPEVAGKRDLPLSEVLDAGRERLAGSLQGQPLVRAEMGGILGSVYQNIGQRNQALAMYEEAIPVARASGDQVLLARLLHKQAYTLYDQEDFPAAEPIVREAIALRERLAPHSLELAESLRLLGTILAYQGRRDESHGMLHRALDIARQQQGPEGIAVAQVRIDLARTHVILDINGRESTRHARAALSIFEREFGADHYHYLNALEVLVFGRRADGDFDEAMLLTRELADKRAALYGETSYPVAYALFNLASVLDAAGRRLEALPEIERSLAIQTRLDGPNAISHTSPMYVRAKIEFNLGRLDSAYSSFRELVDLRSPLGMENDMFLTEYNYYLGRIKRQTGDPLAAQPYIEAILRQLHASASPAPYVLLKNQLEMAAILRIQGHLDQAADMLAQIDPASLGDDDWLLCDTDIERARLAAALGKNAEALALFKSGEARIDRGLGPDHPESWLLRIPRAQFLASTGQVDSARSLAREIQLKAAPSIAEDGLWARQLNAILELADPPDASTGL